MKLPSINRTLLPIKIAYLFYFFSFASITPFLAVFLKANGLDAEQAGIINGSRQLVQFISGIVWGILADKRKRHKVFLIIQVVASSLLLFSLPWMLKTFPKNSESESAGIFLLRNHSINNQSSRMTYASLTSKKLETGRENNARNTSLHLTTANSSTWSPNVVCVNLNATIKNATSVPFITGSNMKTSKINTITKYSTRSGEETNSHPLVFVVMLFILNAAAFFDGGIPLMLDTIIMEIVKDTSNRNNKEVDFGKQRILGSVGYAIASFATGLGVKLTGKGRPNYLTMFFIYFGGNICLLMTCLQLKKSNAHHHPKQEALMDDKVNKITKPKMKNLVAVLKQLNVLYFFGTMFIMGMSCSLFMGYLFWFIKDLNGSEILMGLNYTVASFSNMVFFAISRWFIKVVGGNIAALGVALFAYGLQFIVLSYLTNPWYTLILQLFGGVNFALVWVAAVSHATYLAPPGLTSSLLGILNGIFFGISTGTGIVIGGIIYKMYSGRILYRVFSIVCVTWSATSVLYVLNLKRIRKKSRYHDNDGDENQNPTECKDVPTEMEKLTQKDNMI